MPTFTPPTVIEGPAGGGTLFSRYRLPRGITVLKENGVYSSVRFPDVDRVNAAQEVYLGGHIYTITEAVSALLIDAGYENYITQTDVFADLFTEHFE